MHALFTLLLSVVKVTPTLQPIRRGNIDKESRTEAQLNEKQSLEKKREERIHPFTEFSPRIYFKRYY